MFTKCYKTEVDNKKSGYLMNIITVYDDMIFGRQSIKKNPSQASARDGFWFIWFS